MELGAAGVMVTSRSGARTGKQIVTYFQQVDEYLGGDVPIVLQDFPLSTGVQISDEALGTIIDEVPSMAMLKHEDWPGLSKTSRLRAAEAQGRRRVSVLCGNGGIFLVEEMQRGADSAMTGFAYPEMMLESARLVPAGEMDRAQDLFDAYLPLGRYETQPGLGLAVRKHALARRGATPHRRCGHRALAWMQQPR